MNKKPWLVLNLGDGWSAVLPDNDTKPHAKIVLVSGEEKTATVAEFDCPCKPQVDFKDKIIIHNAFDERKN